MESEALITYIKSNITFLEESHYKRIIQIVLRESAHAATDHYDGVRINLDELHINTLNQIKIFIENTLKINN